MFNVSTIAAKVGWVSRLLLCGTVALGACGGGGDDKSASDAGDAEAEKGSDAGADADVDDGDDAGGDGGGQRLSEGCKSDSVNAGDQDKTLDFGGKSRPYIRHIPSGYKKGQPTPLVVNLHGFLSNYQETAPLTHMSDVADSEGFIVAYPNGAGTPTAWNAGDCCEFTEVDRDDVGFIAALIDEIGSSACLDLSRVYATGFSNGGFLAHELGCKLSDRLGAVASVSGVLGIPPESCKPGRALPVLHIHGDADPTVPYAGGSPQGWELLYAGQPAPTFRSVKETVDFWRQNNGCGASHMQSFNSGDADCESYDGCKDGSEVTLCTISGGGHSWPEGDPTALKGMVAGLQISAFLGKTSASLDASRQIWEFFKRHPLP